MSSAEPSVRAVLETIRAEYPGVPFLALGQTALWDEPMKAVWRRLLDQHLPDSRLIAGVHDTDYFAKTSAHIRDEQAYLSLPHDDGRTRDLWSAAGELSALFGSESIPTRHFYLTHGVPFDWLAESYPGGKAALYADATVAWGWLGLVHTGSHAIIAHDVPVREIAPALLEQLDWGFALSIACLDDRATRTAAAQIAATIRGWVTDFIATCTENCRLSDLYQALLPRLYQLLLGAPPAFFYTTASTELFRFHRRTADLPRFRIVEAFLDPATRVAACQAYNDAVSGSGIYTLEGFGAGAIPFDLVLPGRGRGTIRLAPPGVIIEIPDAPMTLSARAPIESAAALAELIEAEIGPEAVLVGKAVTLVDMIAAEYLVLFHDTASGYTDITRAFNAKIAALGVSQSLYPLVRLAYPTWDALASTPAETTFRLPAHLAATFGREVISAPDFARQWRGVVEAQRHVLRETRGLRKLRDLLSYLDSRQSAGWCDRLRAYEEALGFLKENAAKSDILRERSREHREEMALWVRERLELERRQGEDWRHNIQPLREELRAAAASGAETAPIQRNIDRQIAIRATAFEEPIARCRERIRATKYMIGEFRRQRRLLERSPEALAARAQIASLIREAEMARLELVRHAFLTVESLEHTQLRPTAWWLPLVDSTGSWFDAIVAGTQARFEALL